MSTLTGQIAVVTGGGRGIGRAISLRLGELGAHVVVNYSRSENDAAAVVREIVTRGGSADALQFDVGSHESIERGMKSILDRHGKVSILVNNAGVAIDGLIVRTKPEDWAKTIEVNLSGAFHCSRAVAKSMMKERAGRIINISSIIGEMGNAGQTAYSASKAGLIGLTKSLARELASRSVTVNAITPGYIATDMTAAITDELKAEMLKAIPLGRLGASEDIAEAVAFLSGPAGSYITGQVLGVNGGMYM